MASQFIEYGHQFRNGCIEIADNAALIKYNTFIVESVMFELYLFYNMNMFCLS